MAFWQEMIPWGEHTVTEGIYKQKKKSSRGEKMYKGKAEVVDERTLKLSKPLKSKEKEVTVIIKREKLFREEIDAPQELIDEVVKYEYNF